MPRFEGLPVAFRDRLERIVPGHWKDQLEQALTQPARIGFRVNTLLTDAQTVIDALDVSLTPLTFLPEGFVIGAEDRDRLLTSQVYREGGIWLQNPSSMIPPVVLNPAPEDRLLDLAAAPGSKTLQLACAMGHGADIAAVEVSKARFYRLKRNLDAQGARFVKTFNKDGTTIDRHRPDHFDRVLIDAPCSTEGQMRPGDPSSYAHWSERKVRTMAGKQRRLLETAIRCTRPGGVVVYSTCSFAPEENEAVVQHALDVFGDRLQTEAIELDLPNRTETMRSWEGKEYAPAVGNAVRVLPDTAFEAFFVCRFRRVS